VWSKRRKTEKGQIGQKLLSTKWKNKWLEGGEGLKKEKTCTIRKVWEEQKSGKAICWEGLLNRSL